MGATVGSVSPPRSAMVPQAPPWSSTEHSVKTHFLDALSLLYPTHFLQTLLSLPPAASKFHGKASDKHSGYNDIVELIQKPKPRFPLCKLQINKYSLN